MIAKIVLCLFAMTLCGCGPSAKPVVEQQGPSVKQVVEQVVEQQVHEKFREAVAAMKVCTQGATYNEFREKRLALETCYTANQTALADSSAAYNHLAQVMDAIDILWNFEITWQFPPTEPFIYPGVNQSEWAAVLIINPSVAAKAGTKDIVQCENDPDFNAENYVHRGLTLISSQCDDLLK